MLHPFWGGLKLGKVLFSGVPNFCVLCQANFLTFLGDWVRAILGVIQFLYLNSKMSLIISRNESLRTIFRAMNFRLFNFWGGVET